MLSKTYLNLLILCGVMSQGIIGTVLEQDIDESSEILLRQKRVINRAPGGDQKVLIKDVPYIVIIKEHRTSNFCPGAILTKNIVITAAKCVQEDVEAYRLYAGIARLILGGRYTGHKIIEKRVNFGSHEYRKTDGIALITIDQPFAYSISIRSIDLYEGPIQTGALATVSGWGCIGPTNLGTAHPDYLRSISVPIIDLQKCANIYHRKFPISESDICTLDPYELKFCGHQDAGAPLVLRQNYVEHLVGIHLWNGGIVNQHNPDVYVNLQYPFYRTWIRDTMLDIEKHLFQPEYAHLPHNIHNPQHPLHPSFHQSKN